MRQIDYNLHHTHPLNIEAARARGLVWSENDRLYIHPDGTIPAGYEGNQDSRWGRMSKSDRVFAHK